MKRLCKRCAGTGRLTSLGQLSRSTAPMSVPCGMCGGLGFVDDFGCRTQDANLAAENERLKSKLDAVRKWASNPVRIDDFGYRMAQESVLAILDGDGDDT